MASQCKPKFVSLWKIKWCIHEICLFWYDSAIPFDISHANLCGIGFILFIKVMRVMFELGWVLSLDLFEEVYDVTYKDINNDIIRFFGKETDPKLLFFLFTCSSVCDPSLQRHFCCLFASLLLLLSTFVFILIYDFLAPFLKVTRVPRCLS